MRKNQKIISDLWNTIKSLHSGKQRRKRDKEKGAVRVFEEIMARKF
jgi:hypothetical protein